MLGFHEEELPGAEDQDSHDGDEEDCDEGDDAGEEEETKGAGSVHDFVWSDASPKARNEDLLLYVILQISRESVIMLVLSALPIIEAARRRKFWHKVKCPRSSSDFPNNS